MADFLTWSEHTHAMKNTSRFTEIKSRLHKHGFRAQRWPELLDSPRRADGFLRVIVHEDDDRVHVVRFARNEMVNWELDLPMSLPVPVFDAALAAAFAEVGARPKTYQAKLNGCAVRVTIPQD